MGSYQILGSFAGMQNAYNFRILRPARRRSFLCDRKFSCYIKKTLREDRTAADKKYVACCDPPQAENLASEILFHFTVATFLTKKFAVRIMTIGGECNVYF